MRLRGSGERGAALLTAMVAVAVLTAVAAELAYSCRVSLQIAASGRDELRASWRARGSVSLARMVLTFQQQLDDAGGAGLGALGGALGGSVPRLQIWRWIPVGALAEGLFAASAAPSPSSEGPPPPAMADATIEDESKKVNAQLKGLAATGDRTLWQNAQAVYQLICDARWDPLFDREDRNGQRTSRQDLLVRLRDWVNEGDQSSGLKASGTSSPCGLVIGQPPFETSFGDKNQPYDRGEDRYRAKNARMDSLDELYLVAGVGDAFMAAFRDSLTVYLPQDAKRNVNESDRAKQVELARVIADPPLQPALLDPLFAERLSKAISEKTLGGIFAITPEAFGQAVQLAGVHINAALLSGQNSPFTDRSTTYRIRATGAAGAVESKIEAVVRLGQTTPGAVGQTTPPLPTIIHWRED
jgi:general secretion pathway protein K